MAAVNRLLVPTLNLNSKKLQPNSEEVPPCNFIKFKLDDRDLIQIIFN